MRRLLTTVVVMLMPACGRPEARAPDAASAPNTAGTAVDTALSRDEALRRFRLGLPQTTALEGGDTSREALVQRLLRAIGARDTSQLRTMLMTRAEFAWLYYPTAREALPPYELPPDLMWFVHSGRSDKGLTVAMETFGGKPLRYLGHRCDPEPRREGENLLWGYCTVRLTTGSTDPIDASLFGLVIEREGRFKFVSYANQMD